MLLTLSWTGVAYGQTGRTKARADSLLTVLQATKADTARIRLMAEVAKALEVMAPDRAIGYANRAIANNLGSGTADVEMYIRYGNQVINAVNFEVVQIQNDSQITLRISALIPNSMAGYSMQFSVKGGNSSQTFSVATVEPGGPV